MSRRRPAQGKHLERDQVVAEQVAEVLDSRGPCPGRCNVAHRRRLRQFEEARGRALLAWGGPAHPDLLTEEAAKHVNLIEPRPGRPVWCLRCSTEIRLLLDRLPRMLVLTLETGHVPARRPDGSLVSDPVLVLATSEPDDDGLVVERLSCGHRHTRRVTTAGPVREPGTVRRRCWTCVVGAIVPEPGRLAPGERAARAGHRQPVSPAGSPAWVEADAAIQWVCSTADQVAYALGQVQRDEAGVVVDRWPWRTGSSADRVRAATTASRWLLERLDDVLALPDPLPRSFGRDAVNVVERLTTVSGMRVLVHRLTDACPRCERRGLEREDGGSYVHCTACSTWWDETHFQHLAKAATS